MHGTRILSLFYIGPPSKILTHPTDTYAAAPFSGVFTCSVRGYGYQTITWYKEYGTLPHKHKVNRITSNGVVNSTLIIPNVTEQDIGKYYCRVWANNIGVVSKRADLYLSGTYCNIHMYVYHLLYTYCKIHT